MKSITSYTSYNDSFNTSKIIRRTSVVKSLDDFFQSHKLINNLYIWKTVQMIHEFLTAIKSCMTYPLECNKNVFFQLCPHRNIVDTRPFPSNRLFFKLTHLIVWFWSFLVLQNLLLQISFSVGKRSLSSCYVCQTVFCKLFKRVNCNKV